MEERDWLIIGGLILLVLLLGGGGMMGIGMGFGMLFWVVILIALVYLLGGKSPAKEKTPLEILNERYAKGEITTEEYKRMKEVLK